MPSGTVSWWCDDGDSERVIAFVGETYKAYMSHENSLTSYKLELKESLVVFSTEFNGRVYNISTKEAQKLVKGQTVVLIIKLQEGQKNAPARQEQY